MKFSVKNLGRANLCGDEKNRSFCVRDCSGNPFLWGLARRSCANPHKKDCSGKPDLKAGMERERSERVMTK